MKFLPNTDKQDIVTALLSGQRRITIDNIEIILKALKRDTTYRKRQEAEKQADKIIIALNS